MREKMILGTFILASFIFTSVFALFPAEVLGVFGYGYGCDGGFGYGYSCSSKAETQSYKHYKDKYKNHSAKVLYGKIKYLKKGNDQEFLEYLRLKAIHEKYNHLSTPERRELLTQQEYDDFKLYKKYRGYKKYKELKKDLGL